MKINICQAIDSDLEELCGLYYELHEFHAKYLTAYLKSLGEPSGNDRVLLMDEIKRVINGSDSTILVAESASQVIGLADIRINSPDPTNRGINPTPYAHLQNLVVTQVYRRIGVGILLLQAAEDWSRARGVVDLTLDVWEFADGPQEFYQKAGYRTFRHSLIKNI